MKNCYTLVYKVNSLSEPSNELFDVYWSLNEIDIELNEVLGRAEIEAPASLVTQTLKRISEELCR